MGRNVKLFAVSIIAGVFLVLLLIGAGLSFTPASENPQTPLPISEIEKQQIQRWIEENNLNKYGDPKNTLYPGGTPLYNEGTGETIDLYEYILSNHPDRPWLK